MVYNTAGTQGLLSDKINPETGRALGTYPQVFSHIGLITGTYWLTQVPRGYGQAEPETL